MKWWQIALIVVYHVVLALGIIGVIYAFGSHINGELLFR